MPEFGVQNQRGGQGQEQDQGTEGAQPQAPGLLMVYVLKICVALFMVTFMKWFLAAAFVLAAFMPERIRRIRLW